MRVKIFDPDKIIPPYIHRRDEGELWSLNFEGRVFCCWKCGSGNHIGDKCRDQTRTFDEIFNGNDENNGNFDKPTWAAVVRSGQVETDEYMKKVKEMERKLKEDNQRKDEEKRVQEEKKNMEEYEKERQKQNEVDKRKKVFEEAALRARQLMQEGTAMVQKVSDPEKIVIEDRTSALVRAHALRSHQFWRMKITICRAQII